MYDKIEKLDYIVLFVKKISDALEVEMHELLKAL